MPTLDILAKTRAIYNEHIISCSVSQIKLSVTKSADALPPPAANAFFMYLEPIERSWWLQLSLLFVKRNLNTEAEVVVSECNVLYVTMWSSTKYLRDYYLHYISGGGVI